MKSISVSLILTELVIIFSLIAANRATVHADESIPGCDAVSKAGEIIVYWCEPDYGPAFYINSLGFMVSPE